MKKILAIITLFIVQTLNAQAQVEINYGIEAGYSLTTISTYEFAMHGNGISPGAVVNSKFNGANLSGGGFAEFAFGNHFTAQGGIELASKGAKDINKYSYTALDFPLIANWKFGQGHGFLLYAGPYFDIVIHTNNEVSIGKPDISSSDKLAIRLFHLGARGGIGYQFRNGIFLKGGYQLGITKIAADTYYDEKVSYNGISFNIGYILHIRRRGSHY